MPIKQALINDGAGRNLQCIAVMLAAFAAITVVPSALHTRKAAIANTALGASALAVCCVGFSTINIENDLNVNVDVWSSLDSYQTQGSLLCFA